MHGAVVMLLLEDIAAYQALLQEVVVDGVVPTFDYALLLQAALACCC